MPVPAPYLSSETPASLALTVALSKVHTLKRLAPGVDLRPLAELLGTHLNWKIPAGMTWREAWRLRHLCETVGLNLPNSRAL